jgi:hypothetical protein
MLFRGVKLQIILYSPTFVMLSDPSTELATDEQGGQQQTESKHLLTVHRCFDSVYD